MPVTWNDKAHAKLLVAILQTTNAKLDYAAIADYMGPGCTIVAIRLHIQQLKRQVAEANDSAPATPSKQIRTPRKKKGLGQESRKRKRAGMQQEMDPESPSKKVDDMKNGGSEGEMDEVIEEELKDKP